MSGSSTHVNPNISNNIHSKLSSASTPSSSAVAATASNAQAYEKRTKPADRLSTARLDDLLPTDSRYFELLQWERQLDSHILAKQMRVADAAFKGPKTKRTLRISVYNLAHDQQNSGSNSSNVATVGPYAVFATDSNDGDLLAAAAATSSSMPSSPLPVIPSWTLRVEGKLEAKAGRPSTVGAKKFSAFLHSLIVQVGQDDVVEWKRSQSTTEVDGFEIKRKGDQPVKVKILVALENQPERFRLSPELSSLLSGLQYCTKPHIIMAMWRYVKLNKLQESDEKKVINCDGPLRQLFGVERCTFSELPTLIGPHLCPLDPIEIDYEVQVNKGLVNFSPFVYECEVDVDDHSRSNRSLISSPNLYNLQVDLDAATVRLRELTDSLRATVHNHRLLSDFSSDPVGFIRKTYQQQCEDISAILNDTKINVGDLFRADRYYCDDVEAAVSDIACGISETAIQ